MKLGIDIGGTDVKFAVVANNKIIYKSKIPSTKESAENFIASSVLSIFSESTSITIGNLYITYRSLSSVFFTKKRIR